MRYLLLGAIGAAVAFPALAQEISPIVVTATRVPEPLETLPATDTLLTATQLQNQGDISLSDAFSNVPGVFLAQSGGIGQPASLFIRGADSDEVLVLRDGVPVNDASSPADAFDFGEDLLDDLSRIEIVRGPLSSLYGSSAIGGVVAMTTPQGTGPFSGAASLQAGSQATLLGAAAVQGTSGIYDYAAGFEGASTRGFDITPQRMTYYTGQPDGFRNDTGYLNLGASPVSGTRFGLLLRARQAVEGYDNFGFDDPEGTARLDNFFAKLSADTTVATIWQTGLGLAASRDDRRYYNPLLPQDPTQSSEDSSYRGLDEWAQWHNELTLGTATLEFGAEHDRQSVSVQSLTSSYDFPYDDSVTAHRATNAGYAGLVDRWQRLTISADAREESVDSFGSAFTWRAGANIALPEIASNLRASYGTGFKAPSLYDLFGIDSYGYVGNPHLRPERSTSAELGLRTDLLDHRISSDVAIFEQHIHDLIDYVYDPVDTTENVGRARITGIEASLTLRPVTNFALTIAATHIDPRDLSDNTLLIRRPRNKVSLTAQWQWQKFTLVPEFDYTDSSYDYLYNDSGTYTGTGLGKSGWISNLTAQYRIEPRWTVSLTGRNIFGGRYEPANGYQVAGASVLAGFRATW